MPRPQPQPGDICSARSPAQVLSRRIYCSVSQPCCLCSVGQALSPDTLSSGCQGLERLHLEVFSVLFLGLFPQISFSSTKAAGHL